MPSLQQTALACVASSHARKWHVGSETESVGAKETEKMSKKDGGGSKKALFTIDSKRHGNGAVLMAWQVRNQRAIPSEG